jgi:hypothetical protein
MSIEIGTLPQYVSPVATPRVATPATPGADFSAHLEQAAAPVVADISWPATPPPEVQDQIAAARDRAADLASQNRELHFSKDEETGRVVVQVRDLDGNVIRTIPPSEALAVMTGQEL